MKNKQKHLLLEASNVLVFFARVKEVLSSVLHVIIFLDSFPGDLKFLGP